LLDAPESNSASHSLPATLTPEVAIAPALHIIPLTLEMAPLPLHHSDPPSNTSGASFSCFPLGLGSSCGGVIIPKLHGSTNVCCGFSAKFPSVPACLSFNNSFLSQSGETTVVVMLLLRR